MPQKVQAKACPLMRPLDQTRDVCYYKPLEAHIYNAKRGLQRRKWIVRYPWPRRRDRLQQSRLASIRQAYNSHISKKLQV